MIRNKKNIKTFLSEAFLIIFSVILALVLNEYRTILIEQREFEKARNILVLELKTNKEIIEEYIPYHKKILDNLGTLIQSDSIRNTLITKDGIAFGEFAPNGIIQKFPSNTAWETFQANKIASSLEYDLFYILTKTYNQQSRTLQIVDKIIDFIFSRESLNKKKLRETLMILENYIREFRGRELLLLNYYIEALNKMKN